MSTGMRRGAGLAGALVLGWLGQQASAAVCDSNLLIVLDRSCSMDSPVGGGETRTKWVVALEAINAMLTQYAGKLNFGLTMFPDKTTPNCTNTGPIPVTVGPGKEAMVSAALAAIQPDGPCVTNITTGVDQVNVEPSYAQPYVAGARRGFVLLVTDGMETCDSDAMTVARLTALYGKGYPTFVVGFGGAVDPAALNMFATAGGVPRAGATRYYQTNTATELAQALKDIAGSAVGDPEFGGCLGIPCPDGRCYGAGEVCVMKQCLVPRPDGGSGSGSGDGGAGGDGGARGDGGGGGDGDDDAGCGCQAGARGSAPGGAAMLVLALVLVGRLGRRRLPGRRLRARGRSA